MKFKTTLFIIGSAGAVLPAFSRDNITQKQDVTHAYRSLHRINAVIRPNSLGCWRKQEPKQSNSEPIPAKWNRTHVRGA